MSGIRISRSATAVVHAEGPGGGGSATLCGKGADYIHSTTDDVTCKACIKVLAKQDATEVARHEESLRAGRGAMGHSTPRDYALFLRASSGIEGADKILRDMRVSAGIATDGKLADWLTDALLELGSLAKVPLITGHEAESHSRRGRECRICGQPVAEHESVNVKDGVAVAWWTGTVYDPSAVVNPERVALVEARREFAAVAADSLKRSQSPESGNEGNCDTCGGRIMWGDCARGHLKTDPVTADNFLADVYAQLPVTDKPWSCMVCNERFASLAEIKAHGDECDKRAAQAAADAHYVSVCADPYSDAAYQDTRTALLAAIESAYPNVPALRIEDTWIDCGESISWCAERVQADMSYEARRAILDSHGYMGDSGDCVVCSLPAVEHNWPSGEHVAAWNLAHEPVVTVVTPECVNCGRDLTPVRGLLVDVTKCPWGRCLPTMEEAARQDAEIRAQIAPQDRAAAVSDGTESPSDQTGGEAASVDAPWVFDLKRPDRFLAASRQSLTGTAWRVRAGASKRKGVRGRR